MKKKELSFQFSNSFQSSSYDGGKGRFHSFPQNEHKQPLILGFLDVIGLLFVFLKKIYIL